MNPLRLLIRREVRAQDGRYEDGQAAGDSVGWQDGKAGEPKADVVRTGDEYREGYADQYPIAYDRAVADTKKKK